MDIKWTRVILSLELWEFCSLYIYIYVFVSLLKRFFFAHEFIEIE